MEIINIAGQEVELNELIADCKAAKGKFEPTAFCFTRHTVEGLIARIQELSTTTRMYAYTGRTGCSCCSGDNFTSGPYATAESVLAAVQNSHDIKEVCSQYSSNGCYTIYQVDVLKLHDGRFLIDGRVFDSYAETIRGEHLYGDRLAFDNSKPVTPVQLDNFFYLRNVRKLICKDTGDLVDVIASSITTFMYADEGSKEVRGECKTLAMLDEFSYIEVMNEPA